VLNAHADPQKQKSQAQQCLAQGAKVILLDQLDPVSGASITNLAVSRGAKVIDYDRLVVGSKASYYVSFDNKVVGKLQGRGLVAALKARGQYSNHPVIAELNGDIKDNNAKLFKSGYDSILNPLYKSGTFNKATAGDQWTDWSATKARTIFDQMLARNGNKINGVLAANDGLAGAVVASLKAHGLKSDSAHRPGRDADRRPVHPRRLAERHGLQVRPQGGERCRRKAAIAIIKKKPVPGVNGKVSGTEVDPADPGLDHQGELQEALRGRIPEEEPGLATADYAKYCK
jgi:D-xylose transport system substrate-binding protein